MKIKRRIAIALSMLVVISCTAPVWALCTSEYFYEKGKGAIEDYQQRLIEIEYEIAKLNKYPEKPPGKILFINGEIMGSTTSKEIAVEGKAEGSNATYFIVKNPDAECITGRRTYSGEVELLINEWSTEEQKIVEVIPARKNTHSYKLNALKEERKEIQGYIENLVKARNEEVTIGYELGSGKAYVLKGIHIDGMCPVCFDGSNNLNAMLAMIEWQGAYYKGEIANGLPNGLGYMIEKSPSIDYNIYTEIEAPGVKTWNKGLWVDGKYSKLNGYKRDSKSTILFELNSPGMWAYENMIAIEPENIWARTLSKNGYTMIPIRSLIEAVGGEVQYDSVTKRVDINIEEKAINLTLNESVAVVNGKSVNMPIAAQIINGKTMIPLRFISESLEMKVDWDEKEKIVIITYPEGYGKGIPVDL